MALGGSGADVFVMSQGTIRDFRRSDGDKIEIWTSDFIGFAEFGHNQNEFRAVKAAGGVRLEFDSDGDAIADSTLFLAGVRSLQDSDFIFQL